MERWRFLANGHGNSREQPSESLSTQFRRPAKVDQVRILRMKLVFQAIFLSVCHEKPIRKRSAECSHHRNRLALRAEGPC